MATNDGRLVPFEPGTISQTLFEATEILGQPNALLARELTDRSLQLLAQVVGTDVPTTSQVTEAVVKVVRDSGEAALAQKYQQCAQTRRLSPRAQLPRGQEPPDYGPNPLATILNSYSPSDPHALALQAGRACLREFALREVLAPDVVAASVDGLLVLSGLEAPFELNAQVLGPARPGEVGLVETIERSRKDIGQMLVIDSPDHALAYTSGAHDESRVAYARELKVSLCATNLRAIVNLNCETPPRWAWDNSGNTLFGAPVHLTRPEPLAEHADGLVDQLLRPHMGRVARVDWHLGERDFGAGFARWARLARRAPDEPALAFAFDRPNAPIPLAEGMDRQHVSVLFSVGLHLPRLLETSRTSKDLELFSQKLASLARLALSAGIQKRAFLCRYRPAVSHDPRFAHARLRVTPIGLDTVVRELVGQGLCDGPQGRAAGKHIVQHLKDSLQQDAEAHDMPCCLESFDEGAATSPLPAHTSPLAAGGLTAWDDGADLQKQLEAAAALQAETAPATAFILVPPTATPATEDILALLECAWKHTSIARLRFARALPPVRQLTAPWAADQ
jgi:hypothetical protein